MDYDGVEGVVEYLRQGLDGLQTAWQMVKYIQEELDPERAKRLGNNGKPLGELTETHINMLNRDLLEVRALLGFFDDINYLYKIYGKELDDYEHKSFSMLAEKASSREKGIANVATKLQARWLFPYLEQAQRNLPKEYRLTYEQFEIKLRMADRDATSISYWAGGSY